MRIPWREVSRHFDGSGEGSLPDGVVHGTTGADHALLLLRYQALGWRVEQDGRRLEATGLRPTEDGELPTVFVRPDATVSMNLFLWPGDEIAFDVDAREIHDQATFDTVCRFVVETGRALAADVDLCPEGTTSPFLRYTARTDSVALSP
ncbi:hypothetical protein [Cellulosimicrobium sp. I38E]|uniref:hypothetical protein n=1 Tax=Cellulosimicrobium sp. I38E TaxID=1393139 RepID=UPI000AA8777E|nr:hypothetical protein [Cellulosimicrobium sp. I38E]